MRHDPADRRVRGRADRAEPAAHRAGDRRLLRRRHEPLAGDRARPCGWRRWSRWPTLVDQPLGPAAGARGRCAEELFNVRTDLAATLVREGEFDRAGRRPDRLRPAVEPERRAAQPVHPPARSRTAARPPTPPGEARSTAATARRCWCCSDGSNQEFYSATGVLNYLTFDEYVLDLTPFLSTGAADPLQDRRPLPARAALPRPDPGRGSSSNRDAHGWPRRTPACPRRSTTSPSWRWRSGAVIGGAVQPHWATAGACARRRRPPRPSCGSLGFGVQAAADACGVAQRPAVRSCRSPPAAARPGWRCSAQQARRGVGPAHAAVRGPDVRRRWRPAR